MPRRTSIARASNTRWRYFVAKTQCTCNLKEQCLRCRMLLSLLIDQPYHRLVKRMQAFKFELRTDDTQRRQMRCFAGSCRFVYNRGLALQKAHFEAGEPKLGWLRYRNSRKVFGTVKNVTVSLSCGKWFVSIQTEREVEQPVPRGGAVGIDLGVARFATLSDGSFYVPLNSFKRHATALRT